MRRALVLTTDSARHPFRRSLPPAVFAVAPFPVEPQRKPMTDLAFFLTSFSACFVIVFGLIV